MANAALGTKQVCPTCQSKFYDLGKRPAHCPKCGTDFDPEEAARNRRVRTRGVTPNYDADDEKPDQVKGGAAGDEDEDDEVEVTPELDASAVDKVEGGDEDGDAGPGAGEPGGGESLGVDFDEGGDLEEEGEDVPFLEDEDDDDADFADDALGDLPDDKDDDR